MWKVKGGCTIETKYLKGKLQEYLSTTSKLTADFVVAKTILERLDDFPNVLLKDIAVSAQVAESTVTKFCKKLGYDGFIALRSDTMLADKNQYIQNMLHGISLGNIGNSIAVISQEEAQITKEICQYFDVDKIKAISNLIKKRKEAIILAPPYLIESITFFQEILGWNDITSLRIPRNSQNDVIEQSMHSPSVILVISIKGEWVEEKLTTIKTLKKHGNKIILFTCADIQQDDIDIIFNLGSEASVGAQTAHVMYLHFKTLFLFIASNC